MSAQKSRAVAFERSTTTSTIFNKFSVQTRKRKNWAADNLCLVILSTVLVEETICPWPASFSSSKFFWRLLAPFLIPMTRLVVKEHHFLLVVEEKVWLGL